MAEVSTVKTKSSARPPSKDNLIQDLLALIEAKAEPDKLTMKAQELRDKVDMTRDKLVASIKDGQRRAKRRLDKKSEEFRLRLRRHLRGMFSNDADGSFIKKHLQEPPQLKAIDKACFTLSMLHIIVTELLFVKYQKYFFNYYAVMLVFLMLARYIDYKSKLFHYFLFDLCYFVNFLSLSHGYMFPSSRMFFEPLFVLANGPVLIAVIAWRNSMVFHSVDKMTSLFIHLFPPFYTYTCRWDSSLYEDQKAKLSLVNWLVLPTFVYMFWQVMYLSKTEYFDREKLQSNPGIATSLRWISKDDKNAMNKMAIKYCRKLGIMGPEEKFDSSKWKTKLIFVAGNFIYFLGTLTFIKVVFEHKYAHVFLMFVAVMSAISNGANYYIEVFSERYTDSLPKKQAELNEKHQLLETKLDELLTRKFDEIDQQLAGEGSLSSQTSSDEDSE